MFSSVTRIIIVSLVQICLYFPFYLQLVIFSDGCSSQYKSKLPFLHLTELASSNPGVHLQRCYFGSNHGKSLCDAAGGTAKRCATQAVLSGTKIIQRAETFIAHCSEQMKVTKPIYTVLSISP